MTNRCQRRPNCRPPRLSIDRLVALLLLLVAAPGVVRAVEPLRPKHVTSETLSAVERGLRYLVALQGADGSWRSGTEESYPVALSSLSGLACLANGSTPSRGPYAEPIRRCVDYLLTCAEDESGLISGPTHESGRPMHGHGFALLYLASVYGMESRDSVRQNVRRAIDNGVRLTAEGQSADGGWTYTPGGGDEGSVTVTQVQALRAAHHAGISVPPRTIEGAVTYIGRCATPEGGITYSLRSGGSARLPISAAAVASLYNAGQFEAPVARQSLAYVWHHFDAEVAWKTGTGHDYYCHLYAAQAFYMAGDEYWDHYFPAIRDRLLAMQHDDGSWDGDAVGKVYGTSVALIILQLPFQLLPVYQR